MGRTVSYAWYRFRTTLEAERSYYLSVILLVGALGGLSMGAVAAARSTESSFSDYVASSHVPAALRARRSDQPGDRVELGLQPRSCKKLSHLPHVRRWRARSS